MNLIYYNNNEYCMICIENISDYKNIDIIPGINIDWEEDVEICLCWLFWGIVITFKKI